VAAVVLMVVLLVQAALQRGLQAVEAQLMLLQILEVEGVALIMLPIRLVLAVLASSS
jgi:hypothetical protein